MNSSSLLTVSVLLIGLAPACKTVDKVNNTIDSAKAALDNVNQLAKNFNQTLTDLKSQAKTVGNVAPNSIAKVPALPAKATGGVDTSKPVAAKTGSGSADVDGSGSAEPIQVLEADMSTVAPASLHTLGITTSDDATTFLGWAGDAESGDAGQCYLGWEHASKVWLLIAACNASTGIVCSDDGAVATCSACNEAGDCSECDESKPLSACAAPAM
jgi:hypothetical protein